MNTYTKIYMHLLKKYPERNWDYDKIIKDSYSIEQLILIIREFPDRGWNWKKIFNLVYNFMTVNQYNSTVSKFINDYIDKISNNLCHQLTRYVTPYVIIKNIDKNWNWYNFVHSVYIMDFISMETIIHFIDLGKNLNLLLVSMHEDFTFDIVEKYPNIKWDWKTLTFKATIEFIIEKFDNDIWKWNIAEIARCKKVPLEFVKKHIDKFNVCWGFNRNLRVTPNFIEEFIDENWNWEVLYLINKNIDLDFCIKHKSKFKNFRDFFMINAPCERLHELFDNDINWDIVSSNKNLTMKFIDKNICNINIDILRKQHLTFAIKKLNNQFLTRKKSFFIINKIMSKNIGTYVVKKMI